MQVEAALAERLCKALAEGETGLDHAAFTDLTLDAAKRVQARVQDLRGETPFVMKTALSGGGAVAAPIFNAMMRQGARATVSARQVMGLEVEIAAVLSRDLDADAVSREGEDAVRAAIGRFVVGVELVGSRFRDRAAAGPMAELADNLSTAGYLTDIDRSWPHGDDLAGAAVSVTHDGQVLFAAPARHGFGSVLASLVAYARAPFPSLPLRAGMVVTTGSLCGLVALPGPGHVRATLASFEFDLDVT